MAKLNPEKRLRTRALLLLPLVANAGMLLGPRVGGLLRSQDGASVFNTHPYPAPNLAAAPVYALAALGVFASLEETLESLRHTQRSTASRLRHRYFTRRNSMENSPTTIDSEEPDHLVTMSRLAENAENQASPSKKAKLAFSRIWTCDLLEHPRRRINSPAPCFSEGLGMQPRDVGIAMSTLGAMGVILQVVVYPNLNDRFGMVQIWRSALFVFPIAYTLAPLPGLVGSADWVSGKAVLVWLSVGVVILLIIIGRTRLTLATTLLINDCTPHPSVRSTIHRAGTVIRNLSRSIFLIIAFAIFGNGLDIGAVGLGFWCLGILACVASRWLTKGPTEKRLYWREWSL